MNTNETKATPSFSITMGYGKDQHTEDFSIGSFIGIVPGGIDEYREYAVHVVTAINRSFITTEYNGVAHKWSVSSRREWGNSDSYYSRTLTTMNLVRVHNQAVRTRKAFNEAWKELTTALEFNKHSFTVEKVRAAIEALKS
jgi:hypothetical protein